MMVEALLLAVVALAAQDSEGIPPATASAFLSAIASDDLRAARALLSDDVTIMDDRRGDPVASTLEGFTAHVRDCERTELTWGVDRGDPSKAAITVAWTCPSREPASAFVWTDGAKVVWIQFNLEAP